MTRTRYRYRRHRTLYLGERAEQRRQLQLLRALPWTAAANANPDDYTISFSVARRTPTPTAPVRSSGRQVGDLAAGTTQTTLSLATNENATCQLRHDRGDGIRVHAMLVSPLPAARLTLPR